MNPKSKTAHYLINFKSIQNHTKPETDSKLQGKSVTILKHECDY